MVVTLIGFSGCGKSHLACKLAQHAGFQLFSCDERIEEKLAASLKRQDGSGTRRVAAWLGHPDEPGFAVRQQKYLAAEEESVRESCDWISANSGSRLVIDSTGSGIYMPSELTALLRARSTVIYVEIPETDAASMYEQYLSDPKPVIWNDTYQPASGESSGEALARCYRELLHHRIALYRAMAHKMN